MDVIASHVVLKCGLKKEKDLKINKKMEKVSKPVECVKYSRRVTKKKMPQRKADKLKSEKEILKETLNIRKEKSKKVKESIQKIKKQKNKETGKILRKLKKQKEEPVIENQDFSDITPVSQLLLKNVQKGVAAVLKLSEDQTKSDKVLMDEEKLPIFLQVCCIKIPKTPTRQLRMLLPHSLVSPDDHIALIVKDLKRGRRRDYEPTVDHYQQLLQEHKCTRIKTIIPINQIKTEYDQFELKRNLLFSYDHFLIDGRISGHAARLLGKIFTKKRQVPTSIRLGRKDLKHEVDFALRKIAMQINSKGDTHVVQIGTTSMPKSEIVENIEVVCKNLAMNYPGGWSNIRSLRIKTPLSLSIPIYMTMKSKNTVSVPEIKPKRPKAYRTFEGELTTVSKDATVIVIPDGTVTLKPKIGSVD